MVNSTRYDWKRFWCPREGSIALERDGFLLDPDELPKYVRTDAVSFDVIKTTPCLLLLGEPGIGKTVAIKTVSNDVKTSLGFGEEHLHLDCGMHPDLKDDLFDDPKFKGWLEGRHSLHLFIDGLDEHQDADAASRILGKLERGPRENLHLRIACRTAQVPPRLEPDLRDLYGKDAHGSYRFAVYELTPLRKKDVAAAAKADGLNAEEFLAVVVNRGASALAIKPVTLKFLLNMFRATSELPKSRWDIYEEGCRKLCEENSQSRKSNQYPEKLHWSQRFAIASRIAAACVLGNRSTIYLASNPGDLSNDTLLAEILIGKQEVAQGKEFEVDEAAVQETLTMTGLFNERGKSQLLGWAHQTYAEFLTARFLRERGFRLSDLAGILYPATERIQIVPALREVAAWVASTDVEVFRRLIDQDPQTLLQSDVAMVDDIERKKLVDALLEGFANRRMIDDTVGGRRIYQKLRHSALAEQLEPWICGKDRDWMARRAAIDIAEACNLQTLQQTLANVALDSTDDVNTRVQATRAVIEMGDAQTLQRLRPLAHGKAGDDPNDELRGWALKALWPKYMSAQEMFQCLVRSRRKHFSGRYRVFVSSLIKGNAFSNADLGYALEWVLRQPQDHPFEPFGELADSVLDQAWARVDDPTILHAVVHLADIKFRRHEHPFRNRENRQGKGELPHTDDERRKRFLVALIESTTPFEDDYWTLNSNALLSPQDIPWMIQQLRQDSIVAQRWAALIEVALRYGGDQFELINAIATALPQHKVLRDACWWLAPTELGSAREAEERAAQAKYDEQVAARERHRAEHKEVLLDPPPATRVIQHLDKFENGETRAFGHIVHDMWLRPIKTGFVNHGAPDLAKSPGWLEAGESTRARIVAAAKRYILEAEPKTNKWLGKNVFHWPSMAGYRGVYLLFSLDPQWVERLDTSIWQRWAPAILAYPSYEHDQETSKQHRQLIGMAYRNAPNETLSTLNVLVDLDNRQHNEIFIIRELVHCWDARLGAFFLEKAKEPSLKPSALGFLLDDLLQRNVAGVREYAVSLLDRRLLQKKNTRRRARVAAEALFKQPNDAGWPILQPIFLADPPFGYKVALGAAARMNTYMRDALRWPNLSENELAEFFLWLHEQFPAKEDRSPFSLEGITVTARDTIGDLRGTVLSALSKRGTQEALDALRRIEQILGDDSLRFRRIHAEQEMLARAFRPLAPAEVIDLRPRTKAEPIGNETGTMAKSNPLVERCDVLLMTATEIETNAVIDAAKALTKNEPQQKFGERTYDVLGVIGGAHVCHVRTVQAGSDTPGGSMMTTREAIGDLAPTTIIMVGIAFGVDPEKQPIGHVLISQQLQNYSALRVGTDKETGEVTITPRGDKVSASIKPLDRLKSAKRKWESGELTAEACLLLSGPVLLDNIHFRDALLKEFPEAGGGEMEGNGLYGAAAEKGIPWIIVKAICDYADGNKHENKAARQKLAAERAASFVFHAIAQGGFAPQ